MPRGKYERKKAIKRKRPSRVDRVDAGSDLGTWGQANETLGITPQDPKDYEIKRLTAELHQYKRWLHDQGDAYLDVVERLVDIQRNYSGG